MESAVQSACDMNAQMIILITQSGLVARTVAGHCPTVPVLAFCTDIHVVRRLQLHRALTLVMLQVDYNPYDPKARMELMRAEAVHPTKFASGIASLMYLFGK
jgi:pyruvate kinase